MDEFNTNGLNQQNEVNGSQNQSNSQYSDSNMRYNFIDGTYRGYQEGMGPQTVYPTPQIKSSGKKPRKKGGFTRFLKFTAAALIFGVLAGGATSGYDFLTQLRSDKQSVVVEDQATKTDPITLTPAESTEKEATVVQTGAEAQEGIVSDVSDVVSKVMPSIVAINSSSTITNYDFFTGRQFNEPVQGSGSGIIIGQNDKSILILTNNHVINGAETVEIVFSDETTAKATIKGADAKSDIAVLEVDMKELSQDTLNTIKVARLGNSDALKAGQMVIAIGNALGYGQSVTVGYISALDRQVSVEDVTMSLIQTDAAINPGNSGGALINTAGEVVGMNSVKYASEEVEGMGYAIPISNAIPMIEQLMNKEVVDETEQGYLGINLQSAQDITDAFSQQFHMPLGVYVNEVFKGTPAEKAGLKAGNIIVGVNGIKVETKDDLVNAISYCKAGETVTVKISTLNNGTYEEKDLSVVLGKRPKE
jgi:serine protease Do